MAKKGNGIFLVFVPVHQQVEPEAVARPGGLREGRSIKAPTTVTLTPRHLGVRPLSERVQGRRDAQGHLIRLWLRAGGRRLYGGWDPE